MGSRLHTFFRSLSPVHAVNSPLSERLGQAMCTLHSLHSNAGGARSSREGNCVSFPSRELLAPPAFPNTARPMLLKRLPMQAILARPESKE